MGKKRKKGTQTPKARRASKPTLKPSQSNDEVQAILSQYSVPLGIKQSVLEEDLEFILKGLS